MVGSIALIVSWLDSLIEAQKGKSMGKRRRVAKHLVVLCVSCGHNQSGSCKQYMPQYPNALGCGMYKYKSGVIHLPDASRNLAPPQAPDVNPPKEKDQARLGVFQSYFEDEFRTKENKNNG